MWAAALGPTTTCACAGMLQAKNKAHAQQVQLESAGALQQSAIARQLPPSVSASYVRNVRHAAGGGRR